MILNGSQILAEVLVEQGVDTLFGYPGGSILNICDALYDYRDKIKQYVTAHEQGASHAADGYARATGKTGVVLATSGPGATNLVTGIATAYMDSVPMVAITGNVGTDLIGRDSFQEVYIAGITMPVTKHNFVVRKVEDLADTLRAAFRIANTGRKGPVLVDIPKDVTAAKCEFEHKEPENPVYETVIDDETLKTVADVINKAERPVIYFGGGVVSAKGCVELRELMAKAEIPATHTLMAAGIVGYGEPLNLGLLGMHGNVTSNKAVDNADVVLAVGTRFSDRVALNPDAFAKKATIIQIDIDPSEVNKNVPVDYNLIGDVKDVLDALLPLVNEAKHPEWIAQIEEWKKTNYIPQDDASVLKPHQVIGAVCDEVGEDAIFVTDVGQHQLWAAQYCRHLHSRHFLTSGGLGTMGYGYGAALGAKVAFPEKKVVHITGDGSFHMNMNEACTAVSYNLPVITVIMNNSVLGMVRQWQTVFYNRRYSGSEPERVTDYAKVAEGFGLKGFRCTNLEQFKTAMAEAVKLNCPVWIDCVIDREEKVLPMIPAGATIDKMMLD
ncbi:MAG: biosynthetic-type acetolactate synthase large subunit [Oscillospiraceae bacterium]|nr:biosynthetic-type acetolactate synthase large subunit [Oscillospiraceae bacterium]